MWLELFMAVTVQSSFMTYHRVCSQINTTGVHSGAGTAYRSVAPEFTPGFQWGTGTCYSIFSFICMFCRSLFVLCTFSFDHCVVCSSIYGGPGGSMRQVAGSNSSYKPITNTAWVRARLCKLKKGALDQQPQVIKFTSCLPMVGGSLQVLRPPPLLKLVVIIQLKYC